MQIVEEAFIYFFIKYSNSKLLLCINDVPSSLWRLSLERTLYYICIDLNLLSWKLVRYMHYTSVFSFVYVMNIFIPIHWVKIKGVLSKLNTVLYIVKLINTVCSLNWSRWERMLSTPARRKQMRLCTCQNCGLKSSENNYCNDR